jgi:hypothetical protein
VELYLLACSPERVSEWRTARSAVLEEERLLLALWGFGCVEFEFGEVRGAELRGAGRSGMMFCLKQNPREAFLVPPGRGRTTAFDTALIRWIRASGAHGERR